jgi:ribosomal protein L39E
LRKGLKEFCFEFEKKSGLKRSLKKKEKKNKTLPAYLSALTAQ